MPSNNARHKQAGFKMTQREININWRNAAREAMQAGIMWTTLDNYFADHCKAYFKQHGKTFN